MIKKELEKLRTLNATKSMIAAIKEPGKEKGYRGIHLYRYRVVARCQNLNGILKVSICTRNDILHKIYTPKWDIYINYLGDEYITRERQEDGSYKWREAMICNLDSDYWGNDYDRYMYMNPEGMRSIKCLLETKEGGYRGIMTWQRKCKKRIEDKKIKEKTDRWNEEMKPIKETPKGFEDWWHHKAFRGQNYIYYKNAESTEGYCTSCLEYVKLQKKPNHNTGGRCTRCRQDIIYISRAKKKNIIWTWNKTVSCIQKYKSGIVHREFLVRRIDSKDEYAINKSVFTVHEFRRTIIQDDNYQTYEYTDYKKRGMQWNPVDGTPSYYMNLYTRNVNSILKNMHTAYQIACKNGLEMNIVRYLTRERKNPVIEKVYKAGLYNLGKDLINNNWESVIDDSQSALHKALKIDKARMQRLKAMDGGIWELMWLQEEKKDNTIYRDEDIKTIAKIAKTPGSAKSCRLFSLLSLEKICNYINKQSKLRKGASKRKVFDDWNDYISMMQKMKMDCTKEILIKPKDLAIAHNELVMKMSMKNTEKEIEKKQKEFSEAQKILKSGELKKYEYRDDMYCIIAPDGIEDIYREGMTLKHCIHTCDIYFNRIEIRETYLLFLRRAEDQDMPWYTLEIEPGGNIRQKKSVLNEAYEDLNGAIPFLKKWQKWVKDNLSDQDKKLAEKSDKARREGYKELRREKKLIWHGRLQGTLLADALENDFMEAEAV